MVLSAPLTHEACLSYACRCVHRAPASQPPCSKPPHDAFPLQRSHHTTPAPPEHLQSPLFP